MIYQIKGFYVVIKRNIHVEANKIKQKKMKTKLTATPTLYGEDAKRVLLGVELMGRIVLKTHRNYFRNMVILYG